MEVLNRPIVLSLWLIEVTCKMTVRVRLLLLDVKGISLVVGQGRSCKARRTVEMDLWTLRGYSLG